MSEQDLEQERKIAEANKTQIIFRQIDLILDYSEHSEQEPRFNVVLNGKDCNIIFGMKITHRGNKVNYAQLSINDTGESNDVSNGLIFYTFRNSGHWGYGKLIGEKVFLDKDFVKAVLENLGIETTNYDNSILNLFAELINQIYDRSNIAARFDSLIESANALLELHPETHNYRIERDEPYFDSEIGAIINLQSIELYRLPESEGRDLVIEIELLQSGHIRTDIVLRFDEMENKFKVWMINTFNAETCAAANTITLEQAQMDLTESALQYLKPILSKHNLPETEDGITALLQKTLYDELNRTEIAKRTELTDFDHDEELVEIYEGYYQREVEKLKSLIRQYDLILQKMEKGNSAYAFYQWKICCAYAELDELRAWWELRKSIIENREKRKNYLTDTENAFDLEEKKKIVKEWQMKTNSLRLRKNFAMSKRSREWLRGIGEA